MMTPLSVPSVYTIRLALKEIEGVIRLEPSPEDTAATINPWGTDSDINPLSPA
jgi:hypothetical protein